MFTYNNLQSRVHLCVPVSVGLWWPTEVNSLCVVKNEWINMENGSEENPECMLHIIKRTFSEIAEAEK